LSIERRKFGGKEFSRKDYLQHFRALARHGKQGPEAGQRSWDYLEDR
jgi:hypothetical protein